MPSIKNIVIFVAIGLSMVLLYVFFIKGDGEEANLVSDTTLPVTLPAGDTAIPGGAQAGQDFLTLLLNVKNIKLDDSIFASPAFINLHDSSIILIPDGNEGRPNPFAPIGVDAIAPLLTPTTTDPNVPTSGLLTPPTTPGTTVPPAAPTQPTSPTPPATN